MSLKDTVGERIVDHLAPGRQICVGEARAEQRRVEKEGRSRKKQYHYDSAIADYGKAIELKPDSAEIYDIRGYAYSMSGKAAEALKDYSKAIDLDPARAETYFNRGLVYMSTGDTRKAMEDFTEAIDESTADLAVEDDAFRSPLAAGSKPFSITWPSAPASWPAMPRARGSPPSSRPASSTFWWRRR